MVLISNTTRKTLMSELFLHLEIIVLTLTFGDSPGLDYILNLFAMGRRSN